MNKIKLLTDSACDLPVQDEQKYGIEIMSFPITVDNKSYMERIDFTSEEFYEILKNSVEIPVTSQISVLRFAEKYHELLLEGYTDVILVTINAAGSSTYDAAHLALTMFREEHPENYDQIKIHIVDSQTYSMGYGYPLICAAKMVEEGKTAEEIVAYLTDYFARNEIYLSVFKLDFAKKSGRISSAAAFVGEKLGLKPIIAMIGGGTKNVAKARGDKNVIPGLIKIFEERWTKGTPYFIIMGCDTPFAQELAVQLTALSGQPPVGIYHCGSAVAINAGPEIMALVIQGEKRS